jgi:hypothetical protein
MARPLKVRGSEPPWTRPVTSPESTTKDGASMEPSGRNRWQPVANGTAVKAAQVGENRCRALRPVAAETPWQGGDRRFESVRGLVRVSLPAKTVRARLGCWRGRVVRKSSRFCCCVMNSQCCVGRLGRRGVDRLPPADLCAGLHLARDPESSTSPPPRSRTGDPTPPSAAHRLQRRDLVGGLIHEYNAA